MLKAALPQIGADLSHVFCTSGAATVIKCYGARPAPLRCPGSPQRSRAACDASLASGLWNGLDTCVVGLAGGCTLLHVHPLAGSCSKACCPRCELPHASMMRLWPP